MDFKPEIDWNLIQKGAKIMVQRVPSAVPFEAEFAGLSRDKTTVYFFTKNEKHSILSTALKKEIIDVINTGQDNNEYTPAAVDCLRKDKIPQDCDCCEGYDSRICPPIATQFKELMKMVPRTEVVEHRNHLGEEILTCDHCKYVFKDPILPDICPGCGKVIMNTFRVKCDR